MVDIQKQLYRQSMAAFGGISPNYHIELLDRPTIAKGKGDREIQKSGIWWRSINMIRYADERDFDILKKYDKHVEASELQKSIDGNKVLIMLNDELIGWLRYNLFWDSIPFMNMLYVFEGYRGKGYGKQLVDFWEKEMRNKQYKIVMTSTQSDEQAQFFYRKNGYVDCGALLLSNEPLEIILSKSLA